MYCLSGNGRVGAVPPLFKSFKPPGVPPGLQQMPEVRQLYQMMRGRARSFRIYGIRPKCRALWSPTSTFDVQQYSAISENLCPHVYDHFRWMAGTPSWNWSG